MYGTIARLRVKPEHMDELIHLTRSFEQEDVPGFIASYLFGADADIHEAWLIALFVDRDSYRLNAELPEQDARYRKIRALLEADPEWHDGTVVASAGTGSTSGSAGGGF